VVDIEEDDRGRTCLVITELPYQVNPDTLTAKIAELADAGKVTGIADLRDDSSSRTGQRLVVVLKRDAQPRVVLSQLYRHTQLQETFGANMLALVDGVPRTLTLDAFVTQLDRPPDRGHPAPYRVPPARPRSVHTSCAGTSRPSTRSTRSSP
jgi:DNA gyrase subunit A